MNAAQTVTAMVAAAVPLLVALAGMCWWCFKRGQASGAEMARSEAGARAQAEDKAKIQALERSLAQIQVKLEAMRPKPSR